MSKKLAKKKKSIFKFIFIFIIISLIILITIFYISLFKWKSLVTDMLENTPSTVVDIDDNIIATIGNERIRFSTNFEELPEELVNAYVAIEDQRFYNHFGIDIKRTVAAIGSYIINFGDSSFGGSTITQQLVKNLTGNTSNSVKRKISEWIKATQLELFLSKEEILETYFNIIYTGPNLYGVEAGAQYYFNKSVSELTLIESAFLAGINIAPNSFNPFGETDNTEKINNRTKTVLAKMKELNYITEEEYSLAIEEINTNNITFSQNKLSAEGNAIYSYHTDALLDEVIEDLSNKNNISETFATNYLYMSGLTIYSTQDSSIQTDLETETQKSKYILTSTNDKNTTSQSAMIIIDHLTGQVVACIGGLGEKTVSRGLNRATSAIRQTGSASKPIAVLIPAFIQEEITAASVFVDIETTFDDGTEEGYTPTDYNGFQGAITLRRAVESSQNIPFVKIMEKITPATAIKYMEKMGITTLTSLDDNLNLALGGLDQGISPLEMAGAYATIANDGTYIEPTFYLKVVNTNNQTILQTNQKSNKVFSKEIAYILKKLLTEPVTGTYGTATYCSISNIETAAKTGTTNDNYDRWLCGFTSYYTAVTWYGFDMNESINYNDQNPAGQIWASVMKTIHKNLNSTTFEMPNNIETATICPSSGKIANSRCTNTYTEYFITGTTPEACEVH